MITLETVLKTQNEIFKQCQKLVESKGADYNRQKQKSGDTLFNLRTSYLVGISSSPIQGILIRMQDKIQRLNSLATNLDEKPKVKDESIQDTIADLINYATYIQCFIREYKQL